MAAVWQHNISNTKIERYREALGLRNGAEKRNGFLEKMNNELV
jgi:hypothetical protein